MMIFMGRKMHLLNRDKYSQRSVIGESKTLPRIPTYTPRKFRKTDQWELRECVKCGLEFNIACKWVVRLAHAGKNIDICRDCRNRITEDGKVEVSNAIRSLAARKKAMGL